MVGLVVDCEEYQYSAQLVKGACVHFTLLKDDDAAERSFRPSPSCSMKRACLWGSMGAVEVFPTAGEAIVGVREFVEWTLAVRGGFPGLSRCTTKR